MGAKYTENGVISRSTELLNKMKKCLNIIKHAPICSQQKFLLLSLVAVSKVNFGPLVEQSPEKDSSDY